MARPKLPDLTAAEFALLENLLAEKRGLRAKHGDEAVLAGYGWGAFAETISKGRQALGGKAVSRNWLKTQYEAARLSGPKPGLESGRWLRPR